MKQILGEIESKATFFMDTCTSKHVKNENFRKCLLVFLAHLGSVFLIV